MDGINPSFTEVTQAQRKTTECTRNAPKYKGQLQFNQWHQDRKKQKSTEKTRKGVFLPVPKRATSDSALQLHHSTSICSQALEESCYSTPVIPSMHGLKGPPLCFGPKLTTPHLTVKSEGVTLNGIKGTLFTTGTPQVSS